jgi:hypothetical protein
MKAILIANATPLRLLLLASVLVGAAGLTSCETTDPSTDTIVYPTAAEKNRQLQEGMTDLMRDSRSGGF